MISGINRNKEIREKGQKRGELKTKGNNRANKQIYGEETNISQTTLHNYVHKKTINFLER